MKDLAKPTVEAIKLIVENTKKPCRWCGGKGYMWTPLDAQRECHDCDGAGKISQEWKWEPKVGEWCIWENCISLICSLHLAIEKHRITLAHIPGEQVDLDRMGSCVVVEDCIPILAWEEIERVLEGVGYNLHLVKHSIPTVLGHSAWVAEIRMPTKHKCIIKQKGKSRQEIVTRSVIALAKELTRT